jgi:NADPH:quinone reductase-like Zn-dependent oxidoreductase
VRSLGADKIIDYTKEDFTRNGESYDVIFDVVGKASYPGCRHSLKKGGVLLVNLIELPELIQIIRGTVTGRQTVKGGMAVATSASLSFLKELVESGTLKPVIDRMYRLEEAAQAFRYVEQGHKKGTVVLSVTDEGRRQRDPASR